MQGAGPAPSEANAGMIQWMSGGSDGNARSLQGAGHEPIRRLWRPVAVAGAERLSRLSVLINSILPGAIHRDLSGEMFQNLSLAAGCDAKPLPGRVQQSLA